MLCTAPFLLIHGGLSENLQGQPQCRKNVATVGFPSGPGAPIWSLDGACPPTLGTGPVLMGAGAAREASSVANVIFWLFEMQI